VRPGVRARHPERLGEEVDDVGEAAPQPRAQAFDAGRPVDEETGETEEQRNAERELDPPDPERAPGVAGVLPAVMDDDRERGQRPGARRAPDVGWHRDPPPTVAA
jgi:hypothetical protein